MVIIYSINTLSIICRFVKIILLAGGEVKLGILELVEESGRRRGRIERRRGRRIGRRNGGR